jgi:7-keto-8-aminopelargonate synthetase-like enzyme
MDGARLGGAQAAAFHTRGGLSDRPIRRFGHSDIAALTAQLTDLPQAADALVVVDGAYSMSGQLAPLPDIAATCRRNGATLLVDDAHGAGVLAGGRGTCAHFGLGSGEVDILTITFSKAFASAGGAVLGSETLIHFLRHNARALLFSAALPPAEAAAALAALRIIRHEPWHARRALDLADTARTELSALGYTVLGQHTPIVTVAARDDLSVFLACQQLLEHNRLYVNPVVAPASSPCLRVSFTAAHTIDHLEQLVDAFTDLTDAGLIPAGDPDATTDTHAATNADASAETAVA